MFLEPKGRDWGSIVNWDALGKAYATLIVFWTGFLLLGIVWLICQRQQPFIKIRNLPLAIASTLFLHVYLIKICLAYTTNGHFLCSAEYWIMSIYLPFGIALFQAYLAQLRGVWDQQQNLVSRNSSMQVEKTDGKGLTVLDRWRKLSGLRKTYIFIGIGMLVQLIITAVLYAETPTLQGDWSSYKKVTHAKGQALCRKSHAWIPSAFWQLFWTWLYGPYIVYQTRSIRDTHLWRTQVVISVISGIPGSPLWLAALYSPKFKPVNIRFVPPMWLAPGIMVMQFVTIFFPMIEAWRLDGEKRQTLALLEAWDRHNQSMDTDRSLLTKVPSRSSSSDEATLTTPSSPMPSAETRVNTMASLRKALDINPGPLLEFAATREFSAENILFLMQVKRWKQAWASVTANGQAMNQAAVSHLYTMAFEIFVTLVDDRTAEFPINIEYHIRTRLNEVFKSATIDASDLYIQKRMSQLTEPGQIVVRSVEVQSSDQGSDLWHQERRVTTVSTEPKYDFQPRVSTKCSVVQVGDKPEFDEHVFDDAERSILYLVLTNTWQKIVRDKAMRELLD